MFLDMNAGKDNIDLEREKKHVARLQNSLPESPSIDTFINVHGSLGRHEMSRVHHVCAPELQDSVDAEEPVFET